MYRLTAEDRFLRMEMAKDSQGASIPTLATAIGVTDKMLYAAISPDTPDEERKALRVEQWRVMLRLTRSYASLHEFCRTLGFLAIPIPSRPEPSANPLHDLALIAQEMGEASGKLIKALDQNSQKGKEISRNEAADILKELLELMAATAVLSQEICESGGISPERDR